MQEPEEMDIADATDSQFACLTFCCTSIYVGVYDVWSHQDYVRLKTTMRTCESGYIEWLDIFWMIPVHYSDLTQSDYVTRSPWILPRLHTEYFTWGSQLSSFIFHADKIEK